MNRYRDVFALAVLAAALFVVPLAAPGRAADHVSQTRAVSGFDRIRVEGAFDTEITAGGSRTHVVVSGNGDVVARITTAVEGDTLVVGTQPGFALFGGAPKLEIGLPVLRGFANDGAGSARISGLTGGDIDITNAGAASIVAAGHAARENISLEGTGKIDTTALDARDVTVNNNGVGTVHVRASGVLTMTVNGVGAIRYAGNPARIESHVNGVGSIGRL